MKESRVIVFQTPSTSEGEEFEQYGYLLLRGGYAGNPGRVDVISASNPQTFSKPAGHENERLAIEALKKMHPDLAMIELDPWKKWDCE